LSCDLLKQLSTRHINVHNIVLPSVHDLHATVGWRRHSNL